MNPPMVGYLVTKVSVSQYPAKKEFNLFYFTSITYWFFSIRFWRMF